MQPVIVKKGKTVELPVSLGFNVSGHTFLSIIYDGDNTNSGEIALWDISFKTDGTDGELILTLDSSITAAIVQTRGLMNLRNTYPTWEIIFGNYDKDLIEVLFVDE